MPHVNPALAVLALQAATAAAPAPPTRLSSQDTHCGPGAIPLLILGSFHMASPGQDQFNIEVDDVRSPRRQKEIADVLDRLAAFQPTKIAVEAAFKGSRIPQDYEKYLAGQYELSRSEIDQIAFALGRRLGLKSLYPVDYPMWMDGRTPAEIGVPKPRPATAPEKTPETRDEPRAVYRKLDQLVREGTVLEALRYANSDEYTRADHAGYIERLRPDPYSNSLYGKTDLIANWYKRNLRIFTNVYRAAEPGERILLLYGSGHNAILRQLAIDSGDFCLADTSAYLQ